MQRNGYSVRLQWFLHRLTIEGVYMAAFVQILQMIVLPFLSISDILRQLSCFIHDLRHLHKRSLHATQQLNGMRLRETNLQLFQRQIVVITQLSELAVQRSQLVIVGFHAAIIRERPELLSEELSLNETCHVWHTRLLEHSQQSLVLFTSEPHAIAVCCRI